MTSSSARFEPADGMSCTAAAASAAGAVSGCHHGPHDNPCTPACARRVCSRATAPYCRACGTAGRPRCGRLSAPPSRSSSARRRCGRRRPRRDSMRDRGNSRIRSGTRGSGGLRCGYAADSCSSRTCRSGTAHTSPLRHHDEMPAAQETRPGKGLSPAPLNLSLPATPRPLIAYNSCQVVGVFHGNCS